MRKEVWELGERFHREHLSREVVEPGRGAKQRDLLGPLGKARIFHHFDELRQGQ